MMEKRLTKGNYCKANESLGENRDGDGEAFRRENKKEEKNADHKSFN